MMIRVVISLSFLVYVHSQAVAPPGGCLVCGDGKVITNPSGIFEFPGQPTLPCDILQQAGLDGLVPLDQCTFLPDLVDDCNCQPGDLPSDTPSPPTADPPESPVSPDTPVAEPPATPVTSPAASPVVPVSGQSNSPDSLVPVATPVANGTDPTDPPTTEAPNRQPTSSPVDTSAPSKNVETEAPIAAETAPPTKVPINTAPEKTPDPTPRTPDPTPRTPDPTPRTSDPTPRTPDPTPQAPDPTSYPTIYCGGKGHGKKGKGGMGGKGGKRGMGDKRDKGGNSGNGGNESENSKDYDDEKVGKKGHEEDMDSGSRLLSNEEESQETLQMSRSTKGEYDEHDTDDYDEYDSDDDNEYGCYDDPTAKRSSDSSLGRVHVDVERVDNRGGDQDYDFVVALETDNEWKKVKKTDVEEDNDGGVPDMAKIGADVVADVSAFRAKRKGMMSAMMARGNRNSDGR